MDEKVVGRCDLIKKKMTREMGLGQSFDLGIRRFHLQGVEVDLYFVNGLADTEQIIRLLGNMQYQQETRGLNVFTVLFDRLTHQQVREEKDFTVAMTDVLSGLICLVVDCDTRFLLIDVRQYPGRNSEEPDTERVVRGSRDGFTENIIENTALIRRRVRDPHLRHEIIKVGKRSQTDICLSYIEGLCDQDLVDLVKKELDMIQIDALPMADKTLETYLVKQGYNPFPLVRYSERPDVCAAHLFEGHLLVIVDTSPSVMIAPTTYFHHLQHAEEYRQSPFIGTFIRWIRFVGVFLSLFLVPIWYLFSEYPELTPDILSFVGPKEEATLSLFIQLFLADMGIEFLRMAAIHTPTPLTTAMGLIAAVLIGQIAIDVGLFVPEVILYISIASIGSYLTPSYELSIANKVVRLMLLSVTALFGLWGFIGGVTFLFLFLVTTKTFHVPYLWPVIPFDWPMFKQLVFRTSKSSQEARLKPVKKRKKT
ncbi:spore germination protein [Halolactibacillus miurensis]|uniref:Spore germination protein n=1 Tax=Halolactibacillus miurensis TaxID=306541 RepID=A0A1I6PVC7_9BACI|nr:spore germination protein [Halolactibacillus miurensis]GEM04464.1 spore germination protein [Halolactibacillus miurensis]SFS43995.1 stage V sporulation protein AF [Halolactibacillus miurensis]